MGQLDSHVAVILNLGGFLYTHVMLAERSWIVKSEGDYMVKKRAGDTILEIFESVGMNILLICHGVSN